jgi:hydroxyacylglutathione hydrolase
MFFKQFYLGCLAHASYLVGSDGEAFVVDPQRDVEQYIEAAAAEGLTIKYIVETHLHADFVSGHAELAQKVGAQIIFGEKARVDFPHIATTDGDTFKVGAIDLKVLETPGHTPESICLLAKEADEPAMLFTGDTLFVGDVGRPDLVGAQGLTQEEMAGHLYDSLRNKLMILPDDTTVYPAHGAGSLCGKHMSSERSSTIGQQKAFNYALKPMTKAAFVKMMTADLPEVPAYFPKGVELNRKGAVSLNSLGRASKLSPASVREIMIGGALLLDVRSGPDYASGHVKGSLNIGISGQFASWAGTFIAIGTPVILVAEDAAHYDEAVVRLARVGIESVIGCLDGGIQAWTESGFEILKSEVITVEDLQLEIESGRKIQVIDVRRPGEHRSGHVPNALNISLSELPNRVGELEQGEDIAIICASGYRSSIAKSIFERAGFSKLTNVLGGTSAWKNAGFNVAISDMLAVS